MAASAKAGWAILAAAMTMPGLLFYRWWSHQKAEQEREFSWKSRARAPEGNVFQVSPAAGRLVNPMAAAPAPARPAAASVAAALPVSEAAAPKPPAAAAAIETVTLARDPMQSPLDLLRIREAELERRVKQRLPKAIQRDLSIEKHVKLQGIVATPEGASLVLANDVSVAVGGEFRVDGFANKVTVVRISPDKVWFLYNGKKFAKSVKSVNSE